MKKKEIIIERDKAMECGRLYAEYYEELLEAISNLAKDNLISDEKRVEEIHQMLKKHNLKLDNFDKRWLGR